jgi:hypothetical protein
MMARGSLAAWEVPRRDSAEPPFQRVGRGRTAPRGTQAMATAAARRDGIERIPCAARHALRALTLKLPWVSTSFAMVTKNLTE